MATCPFCNLDFDKVENTVICETKNFRAIPSIGSLLDGYVLIVTKNHINSLSELTDEQKVEYENLINRILEMFQKVYGKTPILFEHGTPNLQSSMSATSIIHAHSHIVNFKFKNEAEIIQKYNFAPVKNFNEVKRENYIYFQNGDASKYVSYNFASVSQLMRILIANEINKEQQYNWREFDFNENIVSMLNKFKDI